MRRTDKEVTDILEIEQIINASDICHIALCDGVMPYIVAVHFGYNDKTLYFHCAREGRKLNIIKNNNNVCVFFDGHYSLIPGKTACAWGTHYASVCATGTAEIITDVKEKLTGLNHIMEHYSDRRSWDYSDDKLANVIIVKITFAELHGKQSPAR